MTYKVFVFFLSLGFFASSHSICHSQIDEAVLTHFVQHDLKNEHLTYLNTSPIGEDSVHFFLAKYYLQYQDWTKFYLHYQKGINVAKEDTLFLEIATSKILSLTDSLRPIWFDLEVKKYPFLDKYEQLYRFENNKKSVVIEVPLALRESWNNFKKVSRKSPFVAAVLSTIVPGLGKVYIGNYRTGVLSFFTLSVFGVQAVESYQKKGIEHILTLTNSGFFAGYYFANIAGSYRETKQKKKEFKNQFLIDASIYYHSRISDQLY